LSKKPQKIKRESINILEEMLMGIESTEDLNNSPKEEINPESLSNLKKPDELLDWIQQIDKGISQILDELSMKLNEQLQKFKILPHKLPKQVINMAIQAEVPEHTSSGSPNLLDVLIETENKTSDSENLEEDNTNQITKLIAIHLRLTEIEFAEPNLTLQRKQIRHLLEQAIQLKKQYYKKQQECAIAEAESAWRSAWYE
jgi:hypothetical protein